MNEGFPRIVTNGWRYRIEIAEGEFYKEYSMSLPYPFPITPYWRTFWGARRQLNKLIKQEAVDGTPWRPVVISGNTGACGLVTIKPPVPWPAPPPPSGIRATGGKKGKR